MKNILITFDCKDWNQECFIIQISSINVRERMKVKVEQQTEQNRKALMLRSDLKQEKFPLKRHHILSSNLNNKSRPREKKERQKERQKDRQTQTY